MKKIIYSLSLLSVMFGCKTSQKLSTITPQPVVVKMDLVNVVDDQVKVTVDPGKFTEDQTTFYIPKTVPGTYSIDNYGEFIENLKAYDYLGNELLVAKTDENSYPYLYWFQKGRKLLFHLPYQKNHLRNR